MGSKLHFTLLLWFPIFWGRRTKYSKRDQGDIGRHFKFDLHGVFHSTAQEKPKPKFYLLLNPFQMSFCSCTDKQSTVDKVDSTPLPKLLAVWRSMDPHPHGLIPFPQNLTSSEPLSRSLWIQMWSLHSQMPRGEDFLPSIRVGGAFAVDDCYSDVGFFHAQGKSVWLHWRNCAPEAALQWYSRFGRFVLSFVYILGGRPTGFVPPRDFAFSHSLSFVSHIRLRHFNLVSINH